MEYAYSKAWTRYFGDYKNWLGHGREIKKVADDIQCSYRCSFKIQITDYVPSQYSTISQIPKARPSYK
jgi:hypothetical protein